MSVGYVFPGQGSQSVGMLADIAHECPEVKVTFDQASAVLGYDLWQVTQAGPAEELDKTVVTQPALLAASYAIWQIIQARKPVKPSLMAGHSLGEYTALVCANAISFTDGIKLVAARGKYMQEAAPVGQGALAAIVGLDDAAVKVLCEQAAEGEVLAPANYNSPGQVVIAGQMTAIQRALVQAKAAGAKIAKQLTVSVPSHCLLMKPAAEELAKMLATLTIKQPEIPVISNVDVKIYENADSIRDGLVRQLFMPVRWVETIQVFANQGLKEIVECGPGKVLSGLNKRIYADAQLLNTSDWTNLNAMLQR